jgi:predicted SnoaL-like aldol condensation-catalyzing enzyme
VVAALVSSPTRCDMAGVDIWRFNDEWKMIEHWDVLQQVPETTASGNDMFSQLT